MDLFHAITQGIDNVLTRDWYDTFKAYKMEDNKTEDKTMDTVPGGETSQYESIKTETVPTSKQRGQLGGDSSNTSETAPIDQERGQKTSENIRYGQNISESGMGGKTTAGIGSAGQQGGIGAPGQADSLEDTRKQQGFGEDSGVGG